MWFPDLSPCLIELRGATLLAVGWLERGKPFPTGTVDPRAYQKLIDMKRNPWQPSISLGCHECDLCQVEGEARGTANLFIPALELIYVCPELIVHYMNAHAYAPPESFCRAVLACPPMRSMEYLRAINACGGSRLAGPDQT